ncbi:MAG: helix-turn-helix domain-containing protein [Patescibacteria group bacterium]|nr:helix-turn-helix domain-containing protein [Patescibacteria group bacterium]MDD5294495.1 helix-turn-helix domain-containing protein [Patescibacteria group bacterium]MDD5554337.1 helix-turn-helix domain-containing protein [Patescibacteria group bacterium]
MDETLLKLLEQSGFTKKEALVYLALLEVGQGRVVEIAKKTELKRSIIYVILESLIKRGYISEIPNKKINTYQAIDPSVILKKLQITTKDFSEMLPFLRTLSSKGKKRPKITYHETKEGIWNTYEEMSQTATPLFITSHTRIKRHFPNGVDKWLAGLKSGVYKFRSDNLVPETEEEIKIGKEFLKLGQKVRVLSELQGMNMDFAIFNNKLAITSLEDEPFIVIIESEELVKSMRPIFEIAWQKGREIK